jgi:anti-sigma B factor antagonist
MKFTASQRGSVTVIALEGNILGGPDGTILNGKLHELIDVGTNRVVLDMSGVAFMNSSGLGMLIGGVTTMRNAGGGLKVANASGKIAGLITIAKLSSIIELHPSIDAAVASFAP